MIVLAGPSASGKTELASFLMEHYNLKRVITVTTRSKRIYEKENIDYYFISKDEFLKKIENDEFVEYTKYGESYYGSLKKEISNDKCLVVDIEGMRSYRSLNNKNIMIVFLNASRDVRKERMQKRGDDILDINRRLDRDDNLYKDENIGKVDLKIDTTKTKTCDVAKDVIEHYQKYFN